MKQHKKLNDLVKSMKLSRDTIKPHLRYFLDQNMVKKVEKGYVITNIGEIALEKSNVLEDLMELIEDNGEFFATHDISSIPDNLRKDLHLLRGGFIFSKPDPYELQKSWLQIIEESSWLGGVSLVYHPGFFPFLEQGNKRVIKLVLTEGVLNKCGEDYPDLMNDFMTSSYGELYVCEKATEAFWVSDRRLTLYLFNSGVLDPSNVFICESKRGIEWGTRLFSHYVESSRRIKDL